MLNFYLPCLLFMTGLKNVKPFRIENMEMKSRLNEPHHTPALLKRLRPSWIMCLSAAPNPLMHYSLKSWGTVGCYLCLTTGMGNWDLATWANVTMLTDVPQKCKYLWKLMLIFRAKLIDRWSLFDTKKSLIKVFFRTTRPREKTRGPLEKSKKVSVSWFSVMACHGR